LKGCGNSAGCAFRVGDDESATDRKEDFAQKSRASVIEGGKADAVGMLRLRVFGKHSVAVKKKIGCFPECDGLAAGER
jgi:hypothetical protein